MEADSPTAAPSAISCRPVPHDKVLVVKGIAGLGNRILCAVGGILYARLSGRRLVIDWTDPLYSPNGDNVFHRFFKCADCPAGAEIPIGDSVSPTIWRNHLHEPASLVAKSNGYDPDQVRRELSIDFARLDYQEDVLVMAEYDARVDRMRSHFRGPWQEWAQLGSWAIQSKLLRESLTLQPEIRERVDHFKRTRFDSPTVGVHIRYSDYRVRIFAIIRRLNALMKLKPHLRLFLATDNIEVKKMFETCYPGVLTTPHWYGDPGRAIHTSAARPNCTETAIESLVDMYLLAECDHLIYDASSSFSEVASMLSRAPAHHRIDVSTGTHRKGNRRVRGTITRWMRKARFFSWAFRVLPRVVPIRRL
jgi:hypothetical protein